MTQALPATTAPRRPQRNPLPFAAVPHALAEDARLKPIDLAVARAILKHARADDHAWPSVATLARQVGRTRRTVQFALRRLEGAGWIAAEPAGNPTGRVLVLTWRRDGGATLGAGEAPSMAPPPAQAPAPERDVPVTRLKDREPARARTVSRPRPEPAPIPEPSAPAAPPIPEAQVPEPVAVPVPTPAPASTRRRPRWAASPELAIAADRTADPILAREVARRANPAPQQIAKPAPASTAELLTRLREAPQHPAAAAELLAREFADRKSWPGFLARCQEAWDGRRSPEELAEAYRLASAPGARNPGAVFMSALRRARA
ncbi:helix-turn-helix domain-containing protein [Tundrisphaera sp. TA3]|uniref:helix-turn-helix domain-containing protein n=1 Tax=Tundrisphaera sp. TA3 TaxID=3435775 RepID=UPI003EBCF6F6